MGMIRLNGDQVGLVENVATTLVGGETVFVEGLIHILPRLAKEYKGPAFRLLYLSVALDCVDKGVIKALLNMLNNIRLPI